jgi:hypothetical protein
MQFRQWVVSLCGVALLISSALAQQVNGSITGTVTDSSGASLPAAAVRVQSKSTNATRDTVTDSSGNYNIPFLPPGEYTVNVSAKGFQTQNVASLTLQVQQTLRQDFQLKIGDVADLELKILA